jgi:hypothetical protein
MTSASGLHDPGGLFGGILLAAASLGRLAGEALGGMCSGKRLGQDLHGDRESRRGR